MALKRLEHVNIRTARLAEMRRWYARILGFEDGPRPSFPFDGAWLYLSDTPCIHLVETATPLENREPTIEHAAFEATGLEPLLDRLAAEGVAYDLRRITAIGVVQLHLADPDGNHLHIDFPIAEADALGL